MKTPEELNALKDEAEALNSAFEELSKEDLEQVTGGENDSTLSKCPHCGGQLRRHPWYTDPGVYKCSDCGQTVREVEPVT